MSDSVYKQYLTSIKLLWTLNTERNIPYKIHSISCHQLIRIKQLFRLHLEQDQILQNKLQHLWSSKFFRTGFTWLWTPHKCFRIYLGINWSNYFDKIKTHMIKLISTGSYIVFLDLIFYRHEHMTKLEFYKNSQNFLSKQTIYHN